MNLILFLPLCLISPGQRVIAEYLANNPSSGTEHKYVYTTYIDDRCLFIDRTASGSLPANQEELFYYHCNNLYSVQALTNQSGVVQERYAYGNLTIHGPDTGGTLGAVLTTPALGNMYCYTGRRLDKKFASTSANTLYYYRARYYDSVLGRFINRDPIEYDDGMNMYAYTKNNPANYLDSYGTVTLDDANRSLKRQGIEKDDFIESPGVGIIDVYSNQQLFDEWYALELAKQPWWTNLPKCPCELSFFRRACIRDRDGNVTEFRREGVRMDSPVNPDPTLWNDPIVPSAAEAALHPGAAYSMRSKATPGATGYNQCIYDEDLNLITTPPGAGTVDYKDANATGWFGIRKTDHYDHDVVPVVVANDLDGGSTIYDQNNPLPTAAAVVAGLTRMVNPAGENVLKYYEVRPTWWECIYE